MSNDNRNQIEIETNRLRLRSLRRSDVSLLELNAGDERVARNTTSIPHPMPPGVSEAFVARTQATDRTEDVWAMDGTPSGLPELVGVVGLKQMDRQQSEIGFWVALGFWNSGIASEAVEAVVAANPHASNTLFASVFQDNPASARVLTHAGFDYLGDAEAFSVCRNASVPTWTYLRKMG